MYDSWGMQALFMKDIGQTTMYFSSSHGLGIFAWEYEKNEALVLFLGLFISKRKT